MSEYSSKHDVRPNVNPAHLSLCPQAKETTSGNTLQYWTNGYFCSLHVDVTRTSPVHIYNMRCEVEGLNTIPRYILTWLKPSSHRWLIDCSVKKDVKKNCKYYFFGFWHAHGTQIAQIRLPLTSAGYLTHDGNCNVAVLPNMFCFCGAVGALFQKIYDHSHTIRRKGKKSGVSRANWGNW